MQDDLCNELSAFLDSHALPRDLLPMLQRYYLPLAERLKGLHQESAKKPVTLGINGAQGSGKSTLAAVLALICRQRFGWRVAVLSMDDLYLGRVARQELVARVHPLLATRGVPGTHDVPLGLQTIQAMREAQAGDRVLLPRFDKGRDEPRPREQWEMVAGPVDLLIFEGWCLGAAPQAQSELAGPCNELERLEDAGGIWRDYVNRQLADVYPLLFDAIDFRVFLKVPDFESVLRWRIQQEEGLPTPGMDSAQLARFVLFFERLTRHQLQTQPADSHVVFELDREHRVAVAVYRHDG